MSGYNVSQMFHCSGTHLPFNMEVQVESQASQHEIYEEQNVKYFSFLCQYHTTTALYSA